MHFTVKYRAIIRNVKLPFSLVNQRIVRYADPIPTRTSAKTPGETLDRQSQLLPADEARLGSIEELGFVTKRMLPTTGYYGSADLWEYTITE